MTQYCRYCAFAIDYNGEATDFVCTANANCGDYGAGVMYSAGKAKRANNCKHFELNEIDIFDLEKRYNPKGNNGKSKEATCKQCHYFLFKDGKRRCFCIYGNKSATRDSSVCSSFDYWRNHYEVLTEKQRGLWLLWSGEMDRQGTQAKLF